MSLDRKPFKVPGQGYQAIVPSASGPRMVATTRPMGAAMEEKIPGWAGMSPLQRNQALMAHRGGQQVSFGADGGARIAGAYGGGFASGPKAEVVAGGSDPVKQLPKKIPGTRMVEAVSQDAAIGVPPTKPGGTEVVAPGFDERKAKLMAEGKIANPAGKTTEEMIFGAPDAGVAARNSAKIAGMFSEKPVQKSPRPAGAVARDAIVDKGAAVLDAAWNYGVRPAANFIGEAITGKTKFGPSDLRGGYASATNTGGGVVPRPFARPGAGDGVVSGEDERKRRRAGVIAALEG